MPGRPVSALALPSAPNPVGDHFLKDGKDALAQFGFGVDVLESPQQFRDVVAGLGVQFDVGDVDLAEYHLRVKHGAHGIFRVTKIFRRLSGLCAYQPVFSGKDGSGRAK